MLYVRYLGLLWCLHLILLKLTLENLEKTLQQELHKEDILST